MFASRAPVKFLVLRVTLGTVKTPVAIMPIAIFGYKFINKMINEDEKAAEMSVQSVSSNPHSGLGNLS
jgi:hypothetical protein